MPSNSSKASALFKCKTYEDWLKLIKVWRHFADLPANQQGPALVLPLKVETLDAVLETDDTEITKDDDVDAIINRLNKLFKNESITTKYIALEASPRSIWNIQKVIKYVYWGLSEWVWHDTLQTKSYGIVKSDDILVYRLPK